MLRGVLFFWWSRFLSRPRWLEGPRLSGRASLVGFRTDFVTAVWVSDAFAGILALAGRQVPENPKGLPFRPPLRTFLPCSVFGRAPIVLVLGTGLPLTFWDFSLQVFGRRGLSPRGALKKPQGRGAHPVRPPLAYVPGSGLHQMVCGYFANQ